MTTQQPHRVRILAAIALVALAATAAACSGGGEGGGDTAASAEAPVAAQEAPGAGDDRADFDAGGVRSGSSADAGGVNRTIVTLRSVIRTGEVSVTSEHLDDVRAEVDEVLASLDGVVDRESTRHDRRGRVQSSTLVVRVPVDRFDPAMAALEDLGRTKHSETGSKDVTTEVIDVAERVETLENSLDRLQDYQARARDIDDLIRFEQQITQREAELQSLRSQQAYLRDQTSMSTITLHLSTPEEYVAPPSALEDAGFLTGLSRGWTALKDTVVVVLTVVGAVLPFALVIALLGVPGWVLVRRAARSRSGAPAAAAPPIE